MKKARHEDELTHDLTIPQYCFAWLLAACAVWGVVGMLGLVIEGVMVLAGAP